MSTLLWKAEMHWQFWSRSWNALNCEEPFPALMSVKYIFSAQKQLACGLFSEIHVCQTGLCVWTNCALATPIISKVDLLRTFWESEPRPCFIGIIYDCNAKCLPVWKSVTSISLSATSSIMESANLCPPFSSAPRPLWKLILCIGAQGQRRTCWLNHFFYSLASHRLPSSFIGMLWTREQLCFGKVDCSKKKKKKLGKFWCRAFASTLLSP